MNTFCAHAGNPFDLNACALWSRAVLPALTFAQRGAPAVPFVGGQTLVDIRSLKPIAASTAAAWQRLRH